MVDPKPFSETDLRGGARSDLIKRLMCLHGLRALMYSSNPLSNVHDGCETASPAHAHALWS